MATSVRRVRASGCGLISGYVARRPEMRRRVSAQQARLRRYRSARHPRASTRFAEQRREARGARRRRAVRHGRARRGGYGSESRRTLRVEVVVGDRAGQHSCAARGDAIQAAQTRREPAAPAMGHREESQRRGERRGRHRSAAHRRATNAVPRKRPARCEHQEIRLWLGQPDSAWRAPVWNSWTLLTVCEPSGGPTKQERGFPTSGFDSPFPA